jgi:hypothetical protein
MNTVKIDPEEGLATLLYQTNRPLRQKAAREMIVLERYRRGAISSGKAGRSSAYRGWLSFTTRHTWVSRTST